jgi:hypothetical protein
MFLLWFATQLGRHGSDRRSCLAGASKRRSVARRKSIVNNLLVNNLLNNALRTL